METTLYFSDPRMTARFLALCKRKGLSGGVRNVNGKQHVRVVLKNVTERAKLIAVWSNESCEIINGAPGGTNLFKRQKK